MYASLSCLPSLLSLPLSLSLLSLSLSSALVTETALQRRLCEMLIDHCHEFFPDLPATPTPNMSSGSSTNKWSSIMSPTSSQSPSYQGYPPPTYVSSTEHLPHPLADNAADEGVTVHMMNDESPSPTEKPHPVAILPPTPPMKPNPSSRLSGGNHSPPMLPRQGTFGTFPPHPTSPIPKPRSGSSASNNSFTSAPPNVLHMRNSSGELRGTENVVAENGHTEGGTPVAR